MIDLHLHTTASDGRLEPRELVARVCAAGITVMSVTDHDTVAGFAEARAAAAAQGLTLVTGIEITAVERARDIHVLGYFFDPGNEELARFLEAQRADRLRRLVEIAGRLASLGHPIEVGPLTERAARRPGTSVGRPQIADALVAAGHATDRNDAFDRLIGAGCPAYVPRRGASPEEVIALVGRSGGIASLAHPGIVRNDELIPRLAAAGLRALEARHSDHDAPTERHYRALAKTHGLEVTGGSDFHGDSSHQPAALGAVTLPAEDFERLRALVV
ncbi:MAG: PHP domain-containing protein [Acidobacteria bacterium]|nr:PHP domain-containing protein [Acidobacteriota bacterium]